MYVSIDGPGRYDIVEGSKPGALGVRFKYSGVNERGRS